MKCSVASLITSALVSFNLFASSYIQATDEKIIQIATYIATGEVIGISEQLNGNYPFQYIDIRINKIYKNNDSRPILENETITIKQIGGEAGGVYYKTDGLAKFETSKKVFVAVSRVRNEPEYMYVVAGEQGKFDIENDGSIVRDTTESVFVQRGDDGRVEFHNGKIDSSKLSAMEETIRKLGYIF
jgi:hypothetical protein